MIAAATVMRAAGGDSGTGAPEGSAAWCARFLSGTRTDRLLLWSVRNRLGRVWWRMVEAICLPGAISHWMRRKREIDRLARQAAAQGFTQLVVLGAGLDTLTMRMSEQSLFERILSADHPATLSVIRGAIDLTDDIELLELDLLTHDVASALTASPAFDSTRHTLVVIEGVLMYLPPSQVQHILRSLAALPVPKARLVASWMLSEPGRPVGFQSQSRSTTRWLRRVGEPMLWGSTFEQLKALLREIGWANARFIDLSEVDAGSPRDSGGLRSEQLVVADR